MKGQLLILIGINGSGKSTYANTLWRENPDKYVVVNRDKVRDLLFGFSEGNVHEYYTLPKQRKYEKEVTRYCDTLIHDGLNHGKTVIVDSTNLNIKYINSFRYWNVPTEFKMFHIDPEIAIARDARRIRKVGDEVIERQYSRMKSLTFQIKEKGALADFEPVTLELDKDKEDAFIFDIDGTLAHKGDRSPYDWKRVGEDTVDEATRDVLLSLKNAANHIVICSGRDGVCLPETREWLVRNEIPFDTLMIRREGDMRPDWVVKEEMWRELAEDYNIVGMFDDRLQVVRRARALGLKVFNVEYNNF